jgi:citrate lyase beta subunit
MIIYDLEDSVSFDKKESSREALSKFIKDGNGRNHLDKIAGCIFKYSYKIII